MTSKMFLIAGVAVAAIAAPAQADKGEKGEKRDRGVISAMKAQAGERKAHKEMRAERPQRAERQRFDMRQQVERRSERGERASRPVRIERMKEERRARADQFRQIQRAESRQIKRADRMERAERNRFEKLERADRKRFDRVVRSESKQQRAAFKSVERDRRMVARMERDAIKRIEKQDRKDRKFVAAFRDKQFRPMKVKQDRGLVAIGQRIEPLRYAAPVPEYYRTRYSDTPDYYYRYDDDRGYLYRINRDRPFVNAIIPLFGGYGAGDRWPAAYANSYVPMAYRSYYYDTPDYYHRYDGYGIYRVDAKTQLITALVALLTGQGFGVGQMLPASYSAYNVPLSYRSTYYDRDDAWYRYGDGFIYQVDPDSRRIAARYPIYGDEMDYLVGEPWPAAYPDYNVPFGYRSLYYDTPQNHYRYANGGIYRVDPTTQLIQALVALVSGQPLGIGQPMPAGYGAYNVPMAYRERYYDRDDAWYRYADGYIYEVDPMTGHIAEVHPLYA